jgi:outer membrane protein
VMTSESGRLPTVSAFGGYTQIDPGLVSIPGGRENSWQAGVQASEVIYSGGAVSSSIKASRLTRDAAESGFAESVQSALLQVRVRWYAVLLAREQVGVQEQFIVLLQEELGNARSRVKAGSGSPFEQLRAEVALANGQPGLIRARNAYHVAAVDLLRAIGLPSDESTADRVIGQLQYVPREISLEAALASALAHRPEIRRLENLLTAAEASVDTARAGTRPTVALVAGYTVEQAQLSGPGTDSTIEGWTAGAQASWDIFDGKATRGRVVQSQAAVEQARLTLHDARLAIDADVRRSHASYLDAIELVNSSLKVIEQAEESLRLARSRFGAGAATQLDVLQTQTALTDARSNAAQARHDVSVAYAFLERSAALAPLPAGATLEQPTE